jgi:hypothetical protein
MPDDDGFRDLVRTLKRLKVVKSLPTIIADPELRTRPPRPPRPPQLASVADRPRARLPSLEHVLRRSKAIRWYSRCRRCGVSWVGRVLDTTQPAAVLATLAVMRVPCPVCWARAWASTDQATRESWAVVPSWIVPRWR